MTRAWLVVVVGWLAACGDKMPAPPDPAAYAKMSTRERCEATAPRATPCVEELMVAEVRALDLGSSGLADEMGKQLDASPPSTPDEAWTIHKTACIGSKHTEYEDAIVKCWAEKTCAALAACVYPSKSR